jgi:ankyrin repeat protein
MEVSSKFNNSAIIAAYEGDLQKLQEAINEAVDLNKKNQNGETALIIAIKNGHNKLASIIIEAGADINPINESGKSALSYAAQTGDLELLKSLVSLGADKNIRSKAKQHNLLMLAIGGNHPELIPELIKINDINARDSKNSTALILAVDKNNIESIKTLLMHGADVNLANKGGFTALASLISNDLITNELLELFIEAGADLNIQTKKGQTLFQLAPNDRVRELLAQHGIS